MDSNLFFHLLKNKVAKGFFFFLQFPIHGFDFYLKIKYPPIHMEIQTFSFLDLLKSTYTDNSIGTHDLAR